MEPHISGDAISVKFKLLKIHYKSSNKSSTSLSSEDKNKEQMISNYGEARDPIIER